MSNVKVWIHIRAVREQILQSQKMEGLLSKTAGQLCSRAGDGYSFKIRKAGTRLVATIAPESNEAFKDNRENGTLRHLL